MVTPALYVKLKIDSATSLTCFLYSVTFRTFISQHFSKHQKFHMHFNDFSHAFLHMVHPSNMQFRITLTHWHKLVLTIELVNEIESFTDYCRRFKRKVTEQYYKARIEQLTLPQQRT